MNAASAHRELGVIQCNGAAIAFRHARHLKERLLRSLQQAPALLDWLEKRLGPYPFDSLGFVLVDSTSGMETQTMITLGRDPSDSDPEVLVHEMAHQWYGDAVTPSDWRDVWMNEGMATYLQGAWQDETV